MNPLAKYDSGVEAEVAKTVNMDNATAWFRMQRGQRQSGRQKRWRFFSRSGEQFMLSLWDFCCGKGAWRISYQSSANMSGSLHEAEYHRLIHLTSQDRFLHDATCIRLWYAPSWSRFFMTLFTQKRYCLLRLLLWKTSVAVNNEPTKPEQSLD